jgi:hypothetical protein
MFKGGNMKATAKFKEKLISAKGHKYIHKGYLKFKSFKIEAVDDRKLRIICIHEDGTHLCYLESYGIPDFKMGDTLSLVLDDGSMKIYIR